uniref:Carrier domain-containing protein n=1 Tax=Bionectria ochroleuca TaxID=29856 RepID=A0A8H7KF45_BIOOC
MGSTSYGIKDDWVNEPIAIVGMSAKYAGEATNTENLWRMLINARSAWTPFPSSRFRPEGVYHPNNEKLNTTHVKGAHFLQEDVGLFDAAFFSYSAETAASVDPQYRLQLESVYEALEAAGIPLHSIAGSNTSVFAGVFVHDYRDALLRDADNLPRLMATGTGVPMMSNRISHFFDLRGASMTIETACSSGMVATHQAVQNLRGGESDMAIVGGANLTLYPDMFKALGSAGFLSGEGKSFAFDSRASGYGRGEGVATLVLKRLKDALAAGDPIRAVIRESMLNQDGKTETITTPSLEAQEDLLRGCYAKAGLDTRGTQYFEAHGTGTQAGDTIEARAIANVFQSHREPLLIGSIKTNIGHTEAASGLASIVKTALAMEKGVIPPSINFESPNPKITLEEWNLKLVRSLENWPDSPIRRASINNFGYGGTNAHIILEDAASWISRIPDKSCHTNGSSNGHLNGHLNEHSNFNNHSASHSNGVWETDGQNNPNGPSKILLLSGKDEQACQKMVSNLTEFLSDNKLSTSQTEEFLESLAYTLGQRRTRFPWTAAHPIPITDGIDEVIQILQSPKFKPTRSSGRPRIGMVFTGQGAQWHAMGRELSDAYPVYKASLEEGEKMLKEFGAEWSMIEELSRDAESSRINEVSLSTPICVAVQVSLVRLLRSWGIVPVAVTSHSSGEMAAAYAAGAMSYRQVMAYSYYRAVLAANKDFQGPVKGGMLAVGLGQEETQSYLERLNSGGKAVIACVNSPSSITVAGDVPAILELEKLANEEGVFARRLKVDTAWHSHHMAPIAKVFLYTLESLPKEDTENSALEAVRFSSPVTGGRLTHSKQISRPGHWVESLLQPVQFVKAFTDFTLGDSGAPNVDVIVEVGPHTALGGPIQQILALPKFKDFKLPYYGTLVRKMDARDSIQALASNLVLEGYPVDMAAVNFPRGKGQHVKVLVDMPSYPWNHQIRHWVEPRFNKALCQRSETPHDLLGALVDGSNLEAPSWRHTLRASASPWTRDHVIQSNIVYPAAGYICLAIEAVRQLVKLNNRTDMSKIVGYKLKDVDFLQALVVPDNSDGIEIQTTLRSANTKDIGKQNWKEFEIWTVTLDNQWTQHAKGSISVEFEDLSVTTAIGRGVSKVDIKGYARRVIPADLFSNLKALGIAHGPMFQNMKHIIQSGSEMRSVVTMSIPDTSLPKDLPQNHVLHPVTLDSIITSPYSAVPGAGAHETAAKVPRAVKNFWVSGSIGSIPGHLLKVGSIINHDNIQGMEADLSVHDESGRMVLEIKGFLYQSLGKNLSLSKIERWQTELCNIVHWSLDISFLSPATVSFINKQLSNAGDSSESSLNKRLCQVCFYFMQRTLLEIDQNDAVGMAPHLAKYYTWLKDTVDKAASDQLVGDGRTWPSMTEPEKQDLINQVSDFGVEGEIVKRIGTQLLAMLKGQASPAEVLSQDNLLAKYRSETPRGKRTGSQLAGLLKHLIHKNPRAQILEIGSRDGGMTQYALEALGTSAAGGPHASSYHYTDRSTASFDGIKEDLATWSELLSFQELDIELDPASQGFSLGTYDIVIASHAISATRNIPQALQNIRSLIKPGGALLTAEDIKCRNDIQFVNGLFPGWWLAQESGKDADPLLDSSIWDLQLREAGFNRVELELADCENPENKTSVTLIATVPLSLSPLEGVEPERIVIITSHKPESMPPPEWLESLQKSIVSVIKGVDGAVPLVKNLCSVSNTDASWFADKICVFVGEVDDGVLYDLDSTSLEGIRVMATRVKGLLWVTRGGAVDCQRPELSLASGFVRTLRAEYPGRKLLTLDLDPKGELWSQSSTSVIAQVLQATLITSKDGPAGEKGSGDFEFAERDGIILVPRLYHDVVRNLHLSSSTTGAAEQEKLPIDRFYQRDRLLCLDPERLVFGDDPHADACLDSLPPNMVEVEPRAYGAGLNATRDHIVGVECAGIISRVGTEASLQGYSVGDRVVCILKQSSFPNRSVVNWTAVTHIPPELDFQGAASIPMAFLTAYFSLVEISRLQPTQSVLVHSAASDFGQAAVMIAQSLRAEIYATTSSREGRDVIMQQYGIPASRIFDSENASFSQAILAATNGRGVDVVLNSLSGLLLQESFNLVAPLGHFVEVGKRDLEANSNLEMGSFSRSVSFSSVDIPTLLEHRGPRVHRCLGEIMRLIKSKAVKVVSPIISPRLADITSAMQLLRAESHIGKVVLSVSPDENVPVLPQKAVVRLSPEASYLIVGGNGGLGQSVAHWMVAHGARNLVLLSRSASKSEKTATLAKELMEAGCSRVLPVSCNVASEDDLAKAIQTCAQEGLPPIRGVIHAAFVLQDSFVEKMTLDDWKYTTQSKVAGAWNLHNQFNLPGDLDFFVLFSSINGVLGYASQAAYSAAGAYEDALAHWRVKHCGLPGVSIDLSVVNAVGYVAEAQGAEMLRKSLIRAGRRVIDESHVLSSLESAIQSPFDPQFVVGGINSGPGPHWEADGELGRDMRVLPLKYRQTSKIAGEKQTHQGEDDTLAARMAACSSRDEAIYVVGSALADMLADMFMVPAEEVDLTQSPSQQGVDSLVAVEVRNMLFGQAGAELSIFNIMQSPSLSKLASDVVDRSSHVEFSA